MQHERVLVLSDCRPVLEAIENTWRAGSAEPYVRDRGGMLEAINELRCQLDRVIFVWCPGHEGISGNEYADMVATAYGDRPTDLQLDEVCVSVAAQIEARDWVYEVRSEYCSSDWFLADRRCFRRVCHH